MRIWFTVCLEMPSSSAKLLVHILGLCWIRCHLWSRAPSITSLSWIGFSIEWRSLLVPLCTPLFNLCLSVEMLLLWVCSIGTTSAGVPITSTRQCFPTLLLLALLVESTLCTLSVSKFLAAELFPGRLISSFARQINGIVFQPIAFQIGMICQLSNAVWTPSWRVCSFRLQPSVTCLSFSF